MHYRLANQSVLLNNLCHCRCLVTSPERTYIRRNERDAVLRTAAAGGGSQLWPCVRRGESDPPGTSRRKSSGRTGEKGGRVPRHPIRTATRRPAAISTTPASQALGRNPGRNEQTNCLPAGRNQCFNAHKKYYLFLTIEPTLLERFRMFPCQN